MENTSSKDGRDILEKDTLKGSMSIVSVWSAILKSIKMSLPTSYPVSTKL